MGRDVNTTLSNPSSSGALARELAKQVTRVLAQNTPVASTPERRERDHRQDVLWDTASVLQVVEQGATSDGLIEKLQELPALLERVEDPVFPEQLGQWVSDTWELVGAARRQTP